MRWNEREIEDKGEKEPKEREVPLSKPGDDNYEQVIGSKKRPWLGGNYNA